MEPDFTGYATKANLKCTDGRTIMPNAFEHQDQSQVPLVWQHMHNDVNNVLGYAVLENRSDGVYAKGYFNKSESGQKARELVQHGDVKFMSIYANQLVEKAKQVFHGAIKEVSLVLAGANPGAKIDFVRIQHSDGELDTLDDEAFIYTGLEIEHSDEVKPVAIPEPAKPETKEIEDESNMVQHADTATDEDETIKDVFDSMTEKQKNVVYFMVGEAIEQSSAAEHSDNQEGSYMGNVFEGQQGPTNQAPTLSHDDLQSISRMATEKGMKLSEAFLAHVGTPGVDYGIEDIEFLFPDAKAITATPEFISRRTEWVAKVVDGAKHSPIARIKTLHADITAEEARARGYVKGNLKKEEVFKLLRRVTTPTTIYKKQKLDRDDVVDITDIDVVVWMKAEMTILLQEEIARAILIGDGREPDDEDKINEDHLRPIAWDNEMYAHPITVQTNLSAEDQVEAIIRARKNYKGTGRPTFFTTDDNITDMLMIKNKIGDYVYANEAELAAKLRVTELVPVEVMETIPDLLGIMVNMEDYTIGADKGGQMAFFEDFDIDYNQYKYLKETRISGALTKAKAAVVVKRVSGTTVTPQNPTYNSTTHVITIPNQTGVSYFIDGVAKTGTVTITETTEVEARPNAGYNFPHNTDADWTFVYSA